MMVKPIDIQPMSEDMEALKRQVDELTGKKGENEGGGLGADDMKALEKKLLRQAQKVVDHSMKKSLDELKKNLEGTIEKVNRNFSKK